MFLTAFQGGQGGPCGCWPEDKLQKTRSLFNLRQLKIADGITQGRVGIRLRAEGGGPLHPHRFNPHTPG